VPFLKPFMFMPQTHTVPDAGLPLTAAAASNRVGAHVDIFAALPLVAWEEE